MVKEGLSLVLGSGWDVQHSENFRKEDGTRFLNLMKTLPHFLGCPMWKRVGGGNFDHYRL